MAAAARLSFEAGHRVTSVRTVTDADVRDFARLSGDTQGFHVEEEYARQTRFGRRVAHGTLAVGFVSAALGTQLASSHESVLLISGDLKLPGPMYVGDTITTALEVIKVNHRRRWAILTALCTNQDGKPVLRGEVTVMVDPFPYH